MLQLSSPVCAEIASNSQSCTSQCSVHAPHRPADKEKLVRSVKASWNHSFSCFEGLNLGAVLWQAVAEGDALKADKRRKKKKREEEVDAIFGDSDDDDGGDYDPNAPEEAYVEYLDGERQPQANGGGNTGREALTGTGALPFCRVPLSSIKAQSMIEACIAWGTRHGPRWFTG